MRLAMLFQKFFSSLVFLSHSKMSQSRRGISPGDNLPIHHENRVTIEQAEQTVRLFMLSRVGSSHRTCGVHGIGAMRWLLPRTDVFKSRHLNPHSPITHTRVVMAVSGCPRKPPVAIGGAFSQVAGSGVYDARILGM